ncbi:unnamed protein product [Strongylus vulgaris]|uniref:Uncharacterized protein n=1 Tax=Strongylus vulgaris TaxID=40348 RepID=A0A3P7I4Q6_STRVU|nr:unnamed protein product [Strongylus vulgaris]
MCRDDGNRHTASGRTSCRAGDALSESTRRTRKDLRSLFYPPDANPSRFIMEKQGIHFSSYLGVVANTPCTDKESDVDAARN